MKTKHILFTSLFLLLVLLTKAQDKYEFMIIESIKDELFVSVSSKEYYRETVTYTTSVKDYRNYNPFLKKIEDYQDKGWDVITITPAGDGLTSQYAYLKKKK
jgi:hypothetical protein